MTKRRVWQNATRSGLFFLSLFFFLVACEQEAPPAESPKYSTLVQEVDELDYLVSQSIILRSSDPQDKAAIVKDIRDVRGGLIRIGQNPKDKLGYELIKRATEDIRTRQILEEDRARIEQVLSDVVRTVHATAREHGIEIEIDWILYSNRFSRPLEDIGFLAWPAGKWQVDWALDRSHVKVRGGNLRAHLISPSFDLTGVDRPTVSIEHTINIDRNDRKTRDPWDRQEILRKAFKVKVSRDYTGGDPNEKVCRCTWHELDLGELPASKDFHAVSTAPMDLSNFVGPNVSIMLDYNMEGLGEHWVTWQVSLFRMAGGGILKEGRGRVEKVLNHTFNTEDLDPFLSLNEMAESPRWEPGGFKPGQFDYVKVASRKFKDAPLEAVSAALISPQYLLQGTVEPTMTINEVIRKFGAIDMAELKILVSESYDGGPIRLRDWVEIPRGEVKLEDGKWQDVVTSGISLKGLTKFTLMFWLKTNGTDVTWEILNFNVIDRKGKVESKAHATPPVFVVEEEP